MKRKIYKWKEEEDFFWDMLNKMIDNGSKVKDLFWVIPKKMSNDFKKDLKMNGDIHVIGGIRVTIYEPDNDDVLLLDRTRYPLIKVNGDGSIDYKDSTAEPLN